MGNGIIRTFAALSIVVGGGAVGGAKLLAQDSTVPLRQQVATTPVDNLGCKAVLAPSAGQSFARKAERLLGINEDAGIEQIEALRHACPGYDNRINGIEQRIDPQIAAFLKSHQPSGPR